MKGKYKELIVIFLFVFLSFFTFRDYFLKNQIPLPVNLLVSFYQPWTSYRLEEYPNGAPNKPIGFDNLRIFYPLRKIAVDQIKSLEWPLWNPYYFSGNTLLATYQSAVFHPLSFLFLFLSQDDAWSIIIILQPFLSSLFMYIFLKEINLSRKASLFGAITFSFSGFMVVWWEEAFMAGYSGLFLPLILYAISRLFKKLLIKDFLLLTFGLSFSILSGWFQTTFYVFIFSLVWLIYLQLKNKNRNCTYLVSAAYILSMLISAIHLLPSIEAYINSARGTTDAKFIFDEYLSPFYHLITFLAPDFFGNPGAYNFFGRGFYHEKVIYVGIPTVVFSLLLLFAKKNLLKNEKFFIISFIFFMSLGFSLPTSWLLLYYLKLPFVSTILPSRIFFLSTFCISVVCAFGLEKYLRGEFYSKRLCYILFFLGAVFFLLWSFIIFNFIYNPKSYFVSISLRNFILPSLFFILTFLGMWFGVRTRRFSFIYFYFLLISLISSLYFVNKYIYFSDKKLIYPEVKVISTLEKISGIDRVWTFGKGYIERNLTTYYKIFSPEGYDSIYIRRYGELLFAAQNNGKFSRQIPRTDATFSQTESINKLLDDPYRKKLLSLLSVKYLLRDRPLVKEEVLRDFELVWQDSKFQIYKYRDSFPRAMLVDDVRIVKDEQKILNAIFAKNLDLTKTAILEEKPGGYIADLNKSDDKKSVEISSYTPNKVTVRTKSKKSSLLFLSDNYYPGWYAYVDDKKTKIYRANYSFRSVVVPKGEHLISFRYEPLSFYVGLYTTCFGLISLLLISILIKYKFVIKR